ncbi:MAG: hypothetical protein M1840_001679, partial [Geoglossum simile]
MGRKTPSDRTKLATLRGYVNDLSQVDDCEIKKPLTHKSEMSYQRALDIWSEFSRTYEHSDPNDMRIAKLFVRFYSMSSAGTFEEKSTTHSIDHFWRTFTAAWARKASCAISYEYIHSSLQKELHLPTAKRIKHILTLKDLIILLEQLWRRDWYEYKHERYRVQMTCALLFFCYTSGRIGEFFESSVRLGSGKGLCYQDATFAVHRRKDGTLEIVIELFRQHAKGTAGKDHMKPKHLISERADLLHCNPVLYFMAIALADEAFKDYSTFEEILRIEPPADQDIWHVEWKDEVLKKPIFRMMNPEGPTDRIQVATTYGNQLRYLGHRAGYRADISVHALRREALIKADDNGYSIAERMRFAGQSDPNTFFGSYMSQLSTVDGQASYLGEEIRRDHLDNFRGMGLHRNPHLWQSLSAKRRSELENRPDFLEVNQKIEALTQKIGSGIENTQPERTSRRRLYGQKRRLIASELEAFRKSQPKKLTSSATHEGCSEDPHGTFFSCVRGLMPERDRLASTLFQKASLRSEEGRRSLCDLIALCTQDSSIAYRQGLCPIGDKCHSSKCAMKMKDIPVSIRWEHLYRCYKKSLVDEHGFAELCFQCGVWITGSSEWDCHCQSHLDKPETIPIRCDLLIFRRAPARAGICPFCLSDTSLASHRRMYQYLCRYTWQKHVLNHLQAMGDSKPMVCPHPRCTVSYESVLDLRHHLEDIHCIQLTGKMKRYSPDIDEIDGTQVKRSCSTNPVVTGVVPPSGALRPNFRLKRDSTSNGGWQYTFVNRNMKTTPTPAANPFSNINSSVHWATVVQPPTEFEYASQRVS